MSNRVKKYQAMLFPVFDIALNGLNYFFQIFISWYLIPESYGVLNSLLSFLAIISWNCQPKFVNTKTMENNSLPTIYDFSMKNISSKHPEL